MQDNVYKYNFARWESLAREKALFTRPRLDLTPESAREYLELERLGIEPAGKRVLCLASGGGQQSAAFALLGADVTVFDLSPSQLERDQAAADHYGMKIRTQQGDMRDLSCFEADSFDLVWQPYSLNFVPDSRVVFAQVSRILRSDGLYYFMCANPFFAGLTHEAWNGEGYTLKHRYEDERVTTYPDQEWVYDQSAAERRIEQPVEYTQTLSRMMNALIKEGFQLAYFGEITSDYPGSQPGDWGHFTSIAPPWIESVWRYAPRTR
ncbi:methyltransferase family protein [Paenibacillus taihuensis]|uniref:Methyltransferase family protein n=1 Tax=Paenibacillus taihuensis TaxID=1156355 RepID=A0A3D9R3B4_9BACL|nr:class I SAM-dependent methyltransferase [Paenibacillus taihuensis]REE70484.1 methyltransferase family protein [Paenibacillus taihuensis]